MATHSSILAWKIPWTEELDGPQSMGSQRVRHNWARTLPLPCGPSADTVMAQPSALIQALFIKPHTSHQGMGLSRNQRQVWTPPLATETQPHPVLYLSAQSKNSEHWDNERSKGCSGSTEGLIFSLSPSPEPGCFMAASCWVPDPCPALRQDLSHVSLTVWTSRGLRGVPSIHLQCRGHGFNSWSRQIPRAAGQPSPCTTSTARCGLGPVLRNKRSHSEKSVSHNYRAAPTLRN